MASYRHLARTCVMQTLFAVDFNKKNGKKEEDGATPQSLLMQILDEFAPKLSKKEFAIKMLDGVFKNKKKIEEYITKYAPEWPLEKIAGVDRAVLEIGIYEILFDDDVPAVVAINEAVEIAKHHGDKNSPKFINGVLSSVMNSIKND